jgi:acetyl esterase
MSRRGLAFLLTSPRLCARLGAKRSHDVDGRALDRQLAAILALDDLDHGSDLRRRSPTGARAKMQEQVCIIDAPAPRGVQVDNRSIAGPAGELRVRIYAPQGIEAVVPGIVFFHGGGFVTGDLDTHDALCRRVAVGARARVASLEYRLAPEHRFPAAVDDAIAGVRWVLAQAGELGIDPARVAVMGDSAGGNLSAVVARRMRGEPQRPALQVLIYPATDATCALASQRSMGADYFLTREMIDWYYAHYLGPDLALRRHPDMSPLLAPEVDGCPPALVYVAGFDPLRDEGAAYAERLTAAGIAAKTRELPTLTHGFALMTSLTAAHRATLSITEDVGRSLRATPVSPLA